MVQTCNCLIILEVTRTQSPKTKNTLRALAYFKADGIPELSRTEVGIYKRKQENENSTKKAIKKTRTRPRKRIRKQENNNSTKKAPKKKKKNSWSSSSFFVFLLSCFLL